MSELESFYTWSSDNLNKLLSVSDEEAEQIKIEMGYSKNTDFWSIDQDVVKIRDVLDWFNEWKQTKMSNIKFTQEDAEYLAEWFNFVNSKSFGILSEESTIWHWAFSKKLFGEVEPYTVLYDNGEVFNSHISTNSWSFANL